MVYRKHQYILRRRVSSPLECISHHTPRGMRLHYCNSPLSRSSLLVIASLAGMNPTRRPPVGTPHTGVQVLSRCIIVHEKDDGRRTCPRCAICLCTLMPPMTVAYRRASGLKHVRSTRCAWVRLQTAKEQGSISVCTGRVSFMLIHPFTHSLRLTHSIRQPLLVRSPPSPLSLWL
jgi:hypothetical protein